MSEPRTAPSAAPLWGALMVALLGCTSLDSLDSTQIQEELRGFEIPERDAGDAASVFDSDELCEYPPAPPRAPAAAEDESACSDSNQVWPNCLPDQCDAPDFETACAQLCQMDCEREAWFCDRRHCTLPAQGTYCDTEAARLECETLCGADVACLNAACEDRKRATCTDYTCMAGVNACGGQSCDNSCATAFDGVCDDGSPINAQTDTCAIGTDCADCGAREDACFALGAECFDTVQCCGFENGEAYCVGVADDEELGSLGRCVASCATQECGSGFTCYGLQGGGDACFPFCSDSQ